MMMEIEPDISSSGKPNITKNNSGGIPKMFCKKCNQYFYDWSNSGICPDCGGILTGLNKSRIINGLFLTPPLK
jgi:rRNA maturation endonuclease Nob1